MYLSLILFQEGYQVESFDFGHDEEGDRGLDKSLLSCHAAICASSSQGNSFEEKTLQSLPIKTLLNITRHKISSDLEDGAFSAYYSALKLCTQNQETATSASFFKR